MLSKLLETINGVDQENSLRPPKFPTRNGLAKSNEAFDDPRDELSQFTVSAELIDLIRKPKAKFPRNPETTCANSLTS